MTWRVLLVDDDPSVLETYAGALTAQRAFEIVLASTGSEALRCVKQDPAFDALVLDLALPDTDGMALLTEIRHRAGVRIPAILLTASLDGPTKAKAFAAGFNEALPKPVDEVGLRKTLRTLLGI